MKFIAYKTKVVNGEFKIELDRPCKCRVALAEFNLPNINELKTDENTIDIQCKQIDSTFDNPHRILKTICFNKVDTGYAYYNQWTARHFEFQDVDSQDKFLTFQIKRSIDGKIVRFHSSLVGDPEIFFTLVFEPIKNDCLRWI